LFSQIYKFIDKKIRKVKK